MHISDNGINLIIRFEGFRSKAYKCPAGVWTIGYGTTKINGKPVTSKMTCTKAQAISWLKSDIAKRFEPNVNKYMAKYKWNQNQYDALVSFAYNIGSIDGLTARGTRSNAVISSKIPLYNKAGGKVLKGLVNRRAAEKELFNKKVVSEIDYSTVFNATYYGNRNKDVVAALGNSKEALLNHFITFGMKEGRQACADFNVQVYKNNYPDLQKAFGNDLKQYYLHYINCGKKEGRKAI